MTLDVVPPFASAAAADTAASRLAARLTAAGADGQAAFLLAAGACPRCCLRFAGVQGRDAYAARAPAAAELVAALAGGGGEAASPLPLDRPCSICLGVLQTLDGAAPETPADVLAVAAATDVGAGEWRDARAGGADALAAVVQAERHAPGGAFTLSVSYPAAAAVRAAAAAAALSAAGLPPGPPPGAKLPVPLDVKDAVKLGLGGRLATALGRALGADGQDGVDLAVALHYVHPSSAPDASLLPGSQKPARGRHLNGKRRKALPKVAIGKMASGNAAAAAAALPRAALAAAVGVPPTPPSTLPHVLIRVRRLPILIAGRYLKHERDVSQSPFFIDGARRGRTSVQEEVERVLLPLLDADAAKFVTAGREDMDVRCLGRGRPFVLEVANARAPLPSQEALDGAVAALAESKCGVGLAALALAGRPHLAAIKEGECAKQKSYDALIELPVPVAPSMFESVASIKDLVLQQTTPTRVERRRAMLVRERAVHSAAARPDPAGHPNRFMLTMRTQAGLYVKEFVHGDGGRTVPCLGSVVGVEAGTATILSLDVLAIHMDFLLPATDGDEGGERAT